MAVFACSATVIRAEDADLPEWCGKLPRSVYASLDRVLPDESWFEVYKIRPGVYALYEPRQFQEVISYLILGQKRALLLDTGMGIASIRKVVSRLTPLPVIVLNTHTHADHVGGNAEFSEIWGIEGKYTLGNAKGTDEDWLKDWARPPQICGSLPPGFRADDYKIAPFTIKHHVRDGDEIDLGDRKLQVIQSPGHTPDSICLQDVENKLLFTGDSYYAGQIYLFVPETDLAAYEHSVARLAALKNVALLLPSHNEPIADPKVLTKLLMAAKEVQSSSAKFKMTEEHLREYSFDGFSMLLADKP